MTRSESLHSTSRRSFPGQAARGVSTDRLSFSSHHDEGSTIGRGHRSSVRYGRPRLARQWAAPLIFTSVLAFSFLA
jgi:hypothetical protein